ncbi:MAG: hypothetical protein IAE65_12915 [Ignavibacteria bacterium]|nr:hypothetical protein [Ignavibacteria bacterium]
MIKLSFIFIFLIYACGLFAQSISYQYDNLNRLTRVDYGNGSVVVYTYDANGNRLTETITGIPLPVAPTLSLPLNGSTGILLNPSFDWSNVPNATSYRLQISNNNLFTNILFDSAGITNSQFNLTSNILNTLTFYYWRVSAVNIAGSSNPSETWSFKTIGTPFSVTLLNPPNNSINQPVNVNFNWKKTSDQTLTITDFGEIVTNNKTSEKTSEAILKYWFEITSDTINFSSIIRDSSITDTIKTLSNLSNSTNYFWRVKGKNEVGWGNFSSWFKFTTIVPAPLSPSLISPVNGSIGLPVALKFDWNNIVNATNYRFQLATDSLFNTTILDTVVSEDSIFIPQGKLLNNQKYYWRVNASNIGGVSSYSSIWNFITIQNLPTNLKVYLEGFWNGSYTINDTISIYLASSVSPFIKKDSLRAVLGTSSTLSVNFSNAINGNYYLIIKHRNHLETWSKLPQLFLTNSPVNYDFTISANMAYGDNMKQFGSSWVLFGGDPNQDGSIDAIDIPVFIGQYGTQGYLSCDFNGDNDVNAGDVNIISSNFGITIASPIVKSSNESKNKKENMEKLRKEIFNSSEIKNQNNKTEKKIKEK